MKIPNFETMTKNEAIDYCYRHRKQWLSDSDNLNEREFEWLISILEDGSILPKDLSDYGMDYEEWFLGCKKLISFQNFCAFVKYFQHNLTVTVI